MGRVEVQMRRTNMRLWRREPDFPQQACLIVGIDSSGLFNSLSCVSLVLSIFQPTHRRGRVSSDTIHASQAEVMNNEGVPHQCDRGYVVRQGLIALDNASVQVQNMNFHSMHPVKSMEGSS